MAKWTILSFALMCAVTHDVWLPRRMHFSAEVEASDPLTMQVFYCAATEGNFSSDDSVSAQVRRGRSRVEIDIPAERLRRLRVDFGNRPGRISLSGMRLEGDATIPLEGRDFIFSGDVKEHSIKGDELSVQSSGTDAFAVCVKPLDVAGALDFRRLWRVFPLSALWLLMLFVASRFAVSASARVVSRVGEVMREESVVCSGSRIVSFDFLRIAAFLLVVFAHVVAQAHYVDMPQRWKSGSTYYGLLGVSIFFALSGAALSIGSFRRSTGFVDFAVKRFRAILPPFWVSYVLWMLVLYAWHGKMTMGLDGLKVVQTVFGMDGYFRGQYSNYGLIGEWFLGAILLTYMFAPIVHKAMSARVKVALPSLVAVFGLSVLSVELTPVLGESITLWNRVPCFNVAVHLFEFAYGMFFFMLIRPNLRIYAMVATVSLVYLLCYLVFFPTPLFFCTWSGMLAAMSLFSFSCFVLDFVQCSESVSRTVYSLGKLSFLAFLHHHMIIYCLVERHAKLDARQLAYSCLLVVVASYVLAYLTLPVANALENMIFGIRKGGIASSGADMRA